MNLTAGVIVLFALEIPALLTGWIVVSTVRAAKGRPDRWYCRVLEPAAIGIGMVFSVLYMEIENITGSGWWEQLYEGQKHAPVSAEHLPTVIAVAVIALIGYAMIRYIPAGKLPPLAAATAIAAVYAGIALCVVWSVQVSNPFLILYAFDCGFVFVKAIMLFVIDRGKAVEAGSLSLKPGVLSRLFGKASTLPAAAFLLLIPLIGILVAVLVLFGQAPDAVIRAWTETADWTLSQKQPPAPLPFDGHYLCTVAAGGHRKIVKPLRTGMRHGHRVIVNRQLCIANAFEQVLEERMPRLHRAIRGFYDRTGYPISRFIRTKAAADAVYFIMKPLEWLFLVFLYAVCTNPENRIAVQYPHAKLPE